MGVEVLQRLNSHPSLQILEFQQVHRFLDLVKRLWAEIVPLQCSRPPIIPSGIAEFLAAVLDLDSTVVQLCWIAFGDLAESFSGQESVSVDDDFRVHGKEYKLGIHILSTFPLVLSQN
jgi:hypothetical protein